MAVAVRGKAKGSSASKEKVDSKMIALDNEILRRQAHEFTQRCASIEDLVNRGQMDYAAAAAESGHGKGNGGNGHGKGSMEEKEAAVPLSTPAKRYSP